MSTAEPMAKVAYGFEVAEAVAAALVDHAARYELLEARFQSAVFALEEQGR